MNCGQSASGNIQNKRKHRGEFITCTLGDRQPADIPCPGETNDARVQRPLYQIPVVS